ncbi:MAG TPA: hypothetical protein VNI52_10375 [Sphingobacteriaceae bacterium]|nr:hypothetical protein [Sphingobacteriaceae bacterium]
MKKSKSKSIIEETRKSIKKELSSSLVEQIAENIKMLGHDPVKIKKEIKKAAKQLAKVLSEKMKIGKEELLKELKEATSQTAGSPEQVMQEPSEPFTIDAQNEEISEVEKKPVKRFTHPADINNQQTVTTPADEAHERETSDLHP